MKSTEIIRILKTDGWFEVKRSGSHIHFRHAVKAGLVIVPFHGKDLHNLAYAIFKTGRSAMTRNYMVVYERAAEDNWGAWVPDVSGAVGAGDSLDQVRESVRQGIAIQLEYLAEQALEAPPAVCKVVDLSEFEPEPHYEIEWMTVDLPKTVSHSGVLAKQAA